MVTDPPGRRQRHGRGMKNWHIEKGYCLVELPKVTQGFCSIDYLDDKMIIAFHADMYKLIHVKNLTATMHV